MLKKFLIGTFVLGAMLVSTSVLAAYDFGATTLKVGSRGEAVKNVQIVVGATPVDGVFGNMTKAKVMAWQASNGLTADGVFGNASKAKANSTTVVGTTCPAGQFDPATGKACGTSTLPAGCTATSLFSSTTGLSCTGTTPETGGALVGGAGDITVTKTSTGVESLVAESNTEKVLGFKIEATDSDVSVKNLKITLENSASKVTAGGSYRLSDYADKVEVYMGSTLVGSADTADFSKDVHSYSKSITLSDAVVREGASKKATFYVVVSAQSNLDSNDVNHNTWTVTADNFRFQDATGVIMTDNSTASETFDFTDLAGLGDLKLAVSNASSPLTQNVKVSDSGTTEVLMLEFKAKATGSDMTFDQVALDIASTVDASSTLSDMISELKLKEGTTELASMNTRFASDTDADADKSGDQAYTFDLDNTYTIDQDATKTFKVYAVVSDIDQFTSGSLKVSLKNDGINAEDTTGELLDTNQNSGSVTGSIQTFTFDVPTLALVSTPTLVSYVQSDTASDTYKATFVFNVEASENQDVYLPLDTFAYGTAKNQGVEYTVTGGATVTSAALEYSGANDDVTSETHSYKVAGGGTEKFTFTVYLTGNNVQGKVSIDSVWYETTAPTTTDNNATTGINGTPSIDSGFTNFKTPLVLLSA